MALRINNNLASLSAQRNLARSSERLGRNYSHLATGLRIATAADDAAGLGISERMRSNIRSMNVAIRNANDGVSLVQTAEGALGEVSNILGRLRELSVQASNGTVSDQDKDTLDEEFTQLVSEIDRISQATQFAGISLLEGTNSSISFQVGVSISSFERISVTLGSVRSSELSLDSLDISSASTLAGINQAMTTVDAAINTVNSLRGDFGAVQNRLESTIASLENSVENLTAAESRIRDVDIAFETADMTRNSILQQSAVSVLAQANMQPQLALSLL